MYVPVPVGRAVVVAGVSGLLLGAAGAASAQDGPAAVTFTKDVAPILRRSCQQCHRPNSVAPMSLITYEEVRPWARAIKTRTGLGPRAGVMPPWYIEKDLGIQHYKDDPSLSAEEIATIGAWVDAGAPLGNPEDMPPPVDFEATGGWRLGEPDLVVKLPDITVKAGAPDWWGEITSTPTGLTEDRYVASVEIREVNDVATSGSGRHTVGGRYIFHHMIWSTRVLGDTADGQEVSEEGRTGWPVHEVGRNPDIFDPRAGRLLAAGSSVVSNSVHLHSNGRDTTGRLEVGFRFHPMGYKPELRGANVSLGNGVDIDIRAMEAGQELHAYNVLQQHTKFVTFEPHLHAPGMRMCLEAIWGYTIETLTCAGYDHNWVRGYAYDDDHAPLLPKGTIVHIIGYMDNSPANRNIPDPRNWQGSGNRSVANMFIDLGMQVALTDEQFIEEMTRRKQRLNLPDDHVLGCPLCAFMPRELPAGTPTGQNQ